MEKNLFWQLIESSFDQDCETQSQNLKSALLALSAEDIEAFQAIFDELELALYRWDLWGVAYVINGGCSDDCFADFRAMTIRRGQKFYEAMLAQPEQTALEANLQEGDWDDMFGWAIAEAYQEKTGRELSAKTIAWPAEPTGEKWQEEGDDLERLFPQLTQRFFD